MEGKENAETQKGSLTVAGVQAAQVLGGDDEGFACRNPEHAQENLDRFRYAYGTLVLTSEEQEILTAKFPPSAVRKLIVKGRSMDYIPHTDIARRLNQALGVGQWNLVRVNKAYNEAEQAWYAEYHLYVRGHFIGETVVSHQWVQGNASMSSDDALESTRGVALRRLAAKCLGCGDQVWPCDEGDVGVQEIEQARQQKQQSPRMGDADLRQKKADTTFRILRIAAEAGTSALQASWEAIGKEMRLSLAGELSFLKDVASEADVKKNAQNAH